MGLLLEPVVSSVLINSLDNGAEEIKSKSSSTRANAKFSILGGVIPDMSIHWKQTVWKKALCRRTLRTISRPRASSTSLWHKTGQQYPSLHLKEHCQQVGGNILPLCSALVRLPQDTDFLRGVKVQLEKLLWKERLRTVTLQPGGGSVGI